MTDREREHSPPPHASPDDQAVAAAVSRLLEQHGDSVVDLAHYSRISVASLYRKLAGHARWSAADVGRIARHYGVSPAELYAPAPAGDDGGAAAVPPSPPAPRTRPAPAVDPMRHPFSHTV